MGTVGQHSAFTMYDGEITNNTAGTDGGGVSTANNDFYMNGGSITGNTAANGAGVSVGCHSSADFYMNGGEIKNNTASDNGGGVYVETSYSDIHLSGTANITGNTTNNNANNVYLSSNKTIIIEGNLTAGAQIGVTMGKMPGKGDFTKVAVGTTNHPLTETDRECFTPDAGSDYVIEELEDKFIIKKAGDATWHSHPICGDTCTHKNADGTDQHTPVYWEGVSTLSNNMLPGYYYLIQDVTLKNYWAPAGGVVLDLNGHNITMNKDDSVIRFFDYGTFTLTDCKGENGTWGKITHGKKEDGSSYTGGGIYHSSESVSNIVMYGGSITENTWSYPAGVYSTQGGQWSQKKTFTMYDGEITNNKCTSEYYYGGGVSIAKNITFTMIGGTISDNTAAYGGVYAAYGSTFIMQGGSITGNTAASSGGGVYAAAGSTFTVKGGSISDNTAADGGGVYVGKGIYDDMKDNFIVSGDVQITGNQKTDGTTNNVSLQTDEEGNQACIKVNGALAGTASIGVSAGTIDTGCYKVVAQGSNYTLTATDLGRFSSDEEYIPKLIDNSVAFTNGEVHEHAICGDKDCTEHGNALWIPLTYDGDLKYGSNTADKEASGTNIKTFTLPAGNYYLKDNIELYGSIEISGDVSICLNGKTISTTANCDGPFSTEKYKLTICDCGTSGSIKAKDKNTTYDAVDLSGESAAFDLYGGMITGGEYGVFGWGSVGLYGGTITGNKTGVGCTSGLSLTIGGDVNITGNDRNVYLEGGSTTAPKPFIIDESLTQDARIGITTYPVPTADNNIQIATGATNANLDYSKIFTPDVTDQNYAVSKEDGNLYLGIHQHSWIYSAKEATITIKCDDASGCNLGDNFAATYTVTAPMDLTYSGSGKAATVEASDNTTGLGLPDVSKVAITYTKADGTTLNGAPTDAGTYQASITIGDKTASVTYAIVSKVVTNPTITVDGTYTYDGTEKKPTVVVKDGDNVISKDEYSVSYANNINAGTATVTITDAAGGNYNVSGSTTFTIGKATITVTPTAGQKKTYGDTNEPTLEYSYAGAENSETPAFTGALAREDGTNAGDYAITIGSLKLVDKGDFKADNYELKLADTAVQFTIEPKTLTADDLEFTTASTFTKVYNGNTDCATATVQIKGSAKVNANDIVPEVTGTYAYNNPNVKDAKTVNFTSKETSTQNYVLPEGLIVEHVASIIKADQASLIITSISATYGTDLTLTVDGGRGDGKVTYTVVNGTGEATITEGVLHPEKVGGVTVVATKSGGDNYNDVTSPETTITIGKGDYIGEVSKVVNIMRNRSDVQEGYLFVEDFFSEGQVPEDAWISGPKKDSGEIVTVAQVININRGYALRYNTVANITTTTDQICIVTISSTNYNDIKATLIFRPTDKVPVEISGLTYTGKTYDGSAIEPTGTLKVSDDKVPVKELEVLYEGTSANGTKYSNIYAPKDAGTYKVTYKVKDSNENYTGSVEYTFTISPKDVTADMIGTIADGTYTGNAIEPTPEVKDGKATLISGTDFDFSYDKNTDASENTATVTITGKGNYTGTASRTFTIKPKDIKGAVIKLEQSELPYNGSTQIVKVESVTVDGRTLSSEDDYSIINGSDMFMSAKDAITLTIEGKGNYTGTATTTWKITKIDPVLDNFVVTPGLSTAQTYDGKPKTVTVQTNDATGMGAVKVYYEGTSGTAYTRSEKAPTNVGNYQVILSVTEGTNYNAKEIVAGTLTIDKAVFNVEDVTEFFEYTKTGAQSIDIGSLVPGTIGYTYDVADEGNDSEIFSQPIMLDAADGLMKFTLAALTEKDIDKKVTVPVTIASENYKDVTVKVTIYISPEYRIIEGANSSWTQNTTGTIVIRGNGDCKIFKDVKVDGKVIDHSNYDVTEGSTIITLKAEYLKTLSTGSHTFAIVWNNGIASTNFNVAANTPSNNGNSNNNDSSDNSSNDSSNTTDIAAPTNAPAQELDKVPATGDPFGIWLTLFVISLTGFAGMLVRRKKN